MARFGLFDVDSSPHPTPVIDESEFTLNSIRSTPCPPGRNPSADEGHVKELITIVPEKTGAQPGRGKQPQERAKEGAKDEECRLRNSMATLREKLASSTALINNLRTRNDFYQAENTAKEAQLKKAQEARAMADSAANHEEKFRRFVLVAMFLIVVGIAVYSYWCWYRGPEMQYVLRRRREVLGI